MSSSTCCTVPMRALWAALIMNTLFTSVQICGAVLAKSTAMMGDTSTMMLDSVTYAFNLFAEYRKTKSDPRSAAIIEIAASSFSVVVLGVVTVLLAITAISSLSAQQQYREDNDHSHDVNPQIMFGFTFANLVVDIGMVLSILLRHRGGVFGLCCRFTPPPADAAAASDSSAESPTLVHELTLFSAFAHVGADTMRTLTVLTASIIAWAGNLNYEKADAVSALVVSVIIMLVALRVAWEVVEQMQAKLWVRGRVGPRDGLRGKEMLASDAALPADRL